MNALLGEYRLGDKRILVIKPQTYMNNSGRAVKQLMAKYKIESTYLQFPIILETEANDEAFEMFVAYCDYQGIDEDDIEC